LRATQGYIDWRYGITWNMDLDPTREGNEVEGGAPEAFGGMDKGSTQIMSPL